MVQYPPDYARLLVSLKADLSKAGRTRSQSGRGWRKAGNGAESVVDHRAEAAHEAGPTERDTPERAQRAQHQNVTSASLTTDRTQGLELAGIKATAATHTLRETDRDQEAVKGPAELGIEGPRSRCSSERRGKIGRTRLSLLDVDEQELLAEQVRSTTLSRSQEYRVHRQCR